MVNFDAGAPPRKQIRVSLSKTAQLSYLGGEIIPEAAIPRDDRGLDHCDKMIRIPHDEIEKRTRQWPTKVFNSSQTSSPTIPRLGSNSFGPIVLLFRVKNEQEAVALASDSDFRGDDVRQSPGLGENRICRSAGLRTAATGASSAAWASRSL